MTHDPWDLFLGLWERIGWRYRYENARFFSSPPKYVGNVKQPNGGWNWPYPEFS